VSASSTTIGTLLDGDHATRVRELRNALGAVAGCRPSPSEPHLTLAVVSGVGAEDIDTSVAEVATTVPPFLAQVRGVALVHRSGDRPVLYLPVVRSPHLDRLHTALVDRLEVAHLDGHYRADRWIPHVTVWSGPLVPASMAVIADRLATVSWSVPITDVSRFGRVGVERTVGLQGR
jgi:2'-5' RNA ligase